RMDANLRDRRRVAQADVRRGFTGVDRLVDAVASHDVAADARLAHANVDDVRIGLRDCHGTHRRALDLAIGDWIPAQTPVDCLPHATADGAEVAFLRTTLHAGDGNPSAGALGTDEARLGRRDAWLL